MKRFGVFAALALVAAALQAAPLSVDLVEGTVEIKSGSAWKVVSEGDKIDSASVVRVGKSSFLELSGAGSRVTLTTAGTYTLNTLVTSAPAQDKKVAAVVGKLGRMVRTEAPRSSTTAGVRGDFEGRAEKTSWAEDEVGPADVAAEARKLVDEGKYADAAAKFGEAVKLANPADRAEYQYSQAWAFAAAGDVIPAVKILRPMAATGTWAVSRGILLARLDIDSGAVDEARAILDTLAKVTSLSADESALVKEMQAEVSSAK
jgi:hypothetical protein